MEVGCEHEAFDCQSACAALLDKGTASKEVVQLRTALTALQLQIQDVREGLLRGA